MNYYIVTLQIVGGILTPFIVLLLVSALVPVAKAFREWVEYKQDELEKYRVFDDEAEFYEVPNPSMIGVRLKKGEKIVWEGAVYREGANNG